MSRRRSVNRKIRKEIFWYLVKAKLLNLQVVIQHNKYESNDDDPALDINLENPDAFDYALSAFRKRKNWKIAVHSKFGKKAKKETLLDFPVFTNVGHVSLEGGYSIRKKERYKIFLRTHSGIEEQKFIGIGLGKYMYTMAVILAKRHGFAGIYSQNDGRSGQADRLWKKIREGVVKPHSLQRKDYHWDEWDFITSPERIGLNKAFTGPLVSAQDNKKRDGGIHYNYGFGNRYVY